MLEFQVITPQRHVLETETFSKFWTFTKQDLVRTYGPVFTNVQSELTRVIQRGSAKRVTRFLESMRTPLERAVAERFKDQNFDVYYKLR